MWIVSTRRSLKARRALLGVVMGAFVLSTMMPGFVHAAAKPSFFKTQETMSTNMKPFKKWTGALERYSKESAARKKSPCAAKELNKCNYAKWMEFLKGLKGKPAMEQVEAINTYMNRARYIVDPVNWGEKDYWATPHEFMKKFGDCEDYAIAKYMSLRHLGWKKDTLRVVAVKDLNLKIGHAILIVYLDGKKYVLDNQIKQVVEAKTVRHYQPIFSINEQAWWRHRT